MKATTHFKYLFRREYIYHFRLKLTKILPQLELAFSVITEMIAIQSHPVVIFIQGTIEQVIFFENNNFKK